MTMRRISPTSSNASPPICISHGQKMGKNRSRGRPLKKSYGKCRNGRRERSAKLRDLKTSDFRLQKTRPMFRMLRNIGRVLAYCMLPQWLIIEYPLVPHSLRPRLFRHWFSFPEFVPSACLTGESQRKTLPIHIPPLMSSHGCLLNVCRQISVLINKKVLQHMPQHLKKQ